MNQHWYCDHRLLLALPIGWLVWQLLLFVYRHFIRGGKNLSHQYGRWAIITGATDGIGLSVAHELARKGLNLILISRTASKIATVAQEIKAKNSKCETRELAIDFNRFDEAAKERVVSLIREVGDVGVLVNNVGVSYEFPDNFHELSPAAVQSLIDLNVTSSCQMTYLVLPFFVARKRGLVVFTSSAASLLPNPMLSAYSAAKSYVDQFARSLSYEYARAGVHFQVQNPLYVKTKMAKMSASFTCPTSQHYARCAVRSFGYENQTSPYWVHALMLAFATRLPSSLVASQILSMHIGIKKRAIKKRDAASAGSSSSSKKD